MSFTATVASDDYVVGPFSVRLGRPFGAWVEVLGLGGATGITATTQTSPDGVNWTEEEVSPLLSPGTRYVAYVERPERYMRLVFGASAPGGWTGTAIVAYDASTEAWDLAIEAAEAAEEQARFEAAVSDLRGRLGIDPARLRLRSPSGLFAGR